MILGALEDFDKNVPSTTKQCAGNCHDEVKPSGISSAKMEANKSMLSNSDATVLKAPNSSDTSSASQDDSNAELEAQFAKAAEDFENAMKTMLGNDPGLLDQLDQFAKAAANSDHGMFFCHDAKLIVTQNACCVNYQITATYIC